MAETRKQAGIPRRSRDVVGSTALAPRPDVVPGAMTVEATAKQFYGGNRIRVGQLFMLAKASDFQSSCMVKRSGAAAPVPSATAALFTSGVNVPLEAAEDAPTGNADPLGE